MFYLNYAVCSCKSNSFRIVKHTIIIHDVETIDYKNTDRAVHFKMEANEEVPKSCILSFGQQELQKLVAKQQQFCHYGKEP